jgi:hypothetical protein
MRNLFGHSIRSLYPNPPDLAAGYNAEREPVMVARATRWSSARTSSLFVVRR